MTREEAIKILECMAVDLTGTLANIKEPMLDVLRQRLDAINVAQAALRTPTREQVEKMRGEWIIEDAGDGDRRKKCSLCNQPISGWWGADKFCAYCGSPMTDEAVEIVMERLNKLEETKK